MRTTKNSRFQTTVEYKGKDVVLDLQPNFAKIALLESNSKQNQIFEANTNCIDMFYELPEDPCSFVVTFFKTSMKESDFKPKFT